MCSFINVIDQQSTLPEYILQEKLSKVKLSDEWPIFSACSY